jgi:hypothetical protein
MEERDRCHVPKQQGTEWASGVSLFVITPGLPALSIRCGSHYLTCVKAKLTRWSLEVSLSTSWDLWFYGANFDSASKYSLDSGQVSSLLWGLSFLICKMNSLGEISEVLSVVAKWNHNKNSCSQCASFFFPMNIIKLWDEYSNYSHFFSRCGNWGTERRSN